MVSPSEYRSLYHQKSISTLASTEKIVITGVPFEIAREGLNSLFEMVGLENCSISAQSMDDIYDNMEIIGGRYAINNDAYEYNYETHPCIAPLEKAIRKKMKIGIHKIIGAFRWNDWEPNPGESDYLRAWEFMKRLNDFGMLSNLTFAWEDLQ